ncbi:MAG TPA: hypothetical protein VF844_02060 [Ktedonobacteraceae bacterium]
MLTFRFNARAGYVHYNTFRASVYPGYASRTAGSSVERPELLSYKRTPALWIELKGRDDLANILDLIRLRPNDRAAVLARSLELCGTICPGCYEVAVS